MIITLYFFFNDRLLGYFYNDYNLINLSHLGVSLSPGLSAGVHGVLGAQVTVDVGLRGHCEGHAQTEVGDAGHHIAEPLLEVALGDGEEQPRQDRFRVEADKDTRPAEGRGLELLHHGPQSLLKLHALRLFEAPPVNVPF